MSKSQKKCLRRTISKEESSCRMGEDPQTKGDSGEPKELPEEAILLLPASSFFSRYHYLKNERIDHVDQQMLPNRLKHRLAD